ncbi:VOC family protein [Rossellomorea aquimaris]|uniref:VOC family protein n=1 Tax=Rossellomorea aquimaris TaxID=189382 RepID=UPI0007D0B248|nr:VOC family protein [Rossellomorea aquimaris]
MNFHQKPNIFVTEVTIKVQNLERSLSFYQKVMGFNILQQTKETAILTANGQTPLVTLEQPPNATPKQARTTGLYHFALLLPSRSDLGRMLQHLLNQNIPLGSSDHLVSEAVYLSDPDGNGIEVYCDRPSSQWTWNDGQVKMAVDPIDATAIIEEARGQKWTGLPEGTVMGHIHLHVSELEKTEEFYTMGLGFEVVSRFGHQALFISTGGYHHHIGLNTWNGAGAPKPSDNSVGLRSFTIHFPSKKQLNESIQLLTTMGATVTEEDGRMHTEDPSGNRIFIKA